ILRLGVTVALLMSVHPALALLVLFALPTILTSSWRPAVERSAEERGAPANRLARHLFVTVTTAAPGKEVRLTGIGPRLVARRRPVGLAGGLRGGDGRAGRPARARAAHQRDQPRPRVVRVPGDRPAGAARRVAAPARRPRRRHRGGERRR